MGGNWAPSPSVSPTHLLKAFGGTTYVLQWSWGLQPALGWTWEPSCLKAVCAALSLAWPLGPAHVGVHWLAEATSDSAT